MKLIKMWEDLCLKAKLTVQVTVKVDYGMSFCKAGFNLKGDADGLAFVIGAEIQNRKCYI